MLLEDIATYLEDQNLGLSASNVFLDHVPNTAQDQVVLIREYPGTAPERAGGGVVAENCRIQIVCRAAKYVDARDKAERVYQALDALHDQTINETRYLWIEALAPPASLGRDEKNRPQVVCNYAVMKEQTAV